MQQYFVELIKAKLENLYIDENTIVVLKGFSRMFWPLLVAKQLICRQP